MTQIFSSGRPIMGDLLRATLWCARSFPSTNEADAIWAAFDHELARIDAPRVSKRSLQQRIRALRTPWIAPMVIEPLDWPLLIRLWRTLDAFGYEGMVVGSADAVGIGYGAWLGADGKDYYFGRGDQPDEYGVSLGLRPIHLPLEQLKHTPHTNISVGEAGIKINGKLDKPDTRSLDAKLHSWLVDLTGHIPTTLNTVTASSFRYNIKITSNGWSLEPTSPESTIRLAIHCASRALLAFIPNDKLISDHEVTMTFLRPTDEAPDKLVAERHSRAGHLADWLQIPPLPIVLNLSNDTRAALDARLSAALAGGDLN